MNRSSHAAARAQQRCIPPLVDQWLDQFGEEKHDGQGGVLLYFSRASIRAMERYSMAFYKEVSCCVQHTSILRI